jgi:hypothetical protein
MDTGTDTTCGRCGRTLTSAASIRRGVGRYCQARRREEAATADYTPEQVAKAHELLADGGLVESSQHGTFFATASRGDVIYIVTADTCTCPAGQRNNRCYHRCAVAIRLATTTREAARPAAKTRKAA